VSPPHILPEEDYNKPLHTRPFCFNYDETLEISFFFNPREAAIFKIQEYKAQAGSEYSGCIEVSYCHFNEMALDGVCAVAEDFQDPYEAANEALKAFDIEDEILIGRYAFKDFEVHAEEVKVGKQIKGAYVVPDYQESGISSFVYKHLTKKYGLLICDNYQTYMGHMLWVLSILKWGIIKVYDCVEKKFIGDVEYKDCPANLKPWSIPFNFPMQNEKYLRLDMCVRTDTQFHNIVLVADTTLLT
jgi:hypothetical protein